MIRRYQLRGRSVTIPTVHTVKSQIQPIDYSDGLYTGKPNDLQPAKTLRYITDKRFIGHGKYETRKGCDAYSVPIGEAVNVQVTSSSGASQIDFTTTKRIAEKVTTTASGVLTKTEIRIKNDEEATGTVIVEVRSDDSGEPGELLARTSIDETDVTSSFAYVAERYIATPALANATAYWVVAYLQTSGTGAMYCSTTTNSTNAKISTDGGQTWSSASYSLNVKLHTSTAGATKGLTRVYKQDGTGTTFFAHTTNLYSVNDGTGATTSVDTGINSGSSAVRFEYMNEILYYTDGVAKPRRYDYTSASTVGACPVNASNLMEHVGIMFYFDTDDRTKVVFSNFADPELFTSTDFLYIPAPKKSDYLTAMAKLNGVLYFFTRRNKHMLLGQDRATFRLDEAYAQKGTFSQESVVFDENYIYFASDTGIYKFNGTSEKNIAEGIINDYTGIPDKSDIHLQLHDNKLYVWYTPSGGANASQCFVYNTLYEVWESLDLNAQIGRSFARHDNTDLFLQASNNCGVVYYAEKSTNDYNNLGDILQAEVRTAYDHFGSPQQKKRITYWRPILEQQQGNYTLQAGFDSDYAEDPNFVNIDLQSDGFTYDDAATLYDSATYSGTGVATDTTLEIYGDAYRWQRRYKHHAAREPITFSGEVLQIQTRRLR